MDLESLCRTSARGLPSAGAPSTRGDLLRLDANTNLFGPHPAIRRVLEREAAGDFAFYPDPLHRDLRSALARHYGLSPESLLVGAGADELIDVAIRAFVNPDDRVAIATPTFELYSLCARVEHARVVDVPLGPRFALDVEGMLRAEAKVTFVASPNNPTGNAHPAAALDRLVRASAGIVVIDEAYAEFAGQDFLTRAPEFPNLIVLRTFSKAHGLAGLRVGYAAARADVVERLGRVKMPFSVGALSERIAVEALKDDSFVRHAREGVDREKAALAGRLSALDLTPHPTDANFMLVRVGARAADLVRHLAGRGIAVRPIFDDCIRVTIGRPEHQERLLAAIGEFLK